MNIHLIGNLVIGFMVLCVVALVAIVFSAPKRKKPPGGPDGVAGRSGRG